MSKPKVTAAFVLRTLAHLNRIADARIGHEQLAAFLIRHGVTKDTAGSLGQFLTDVAYYMPDDPVPVCAECGGDWDEARADRRYCSTRCRQRAYRKRVTDNLALGGQAVTNQRSGDASAARMPH